jgi:hypothetical protein
MSNARRQQLDATKFNWDPNDDAWEKGFAALKKFKAREDHCRVSEGASRRGIQSGHMGCQSAQ